MIGVVDYWNNFFAEQEYPPEELLDYNLVKAISYRESRIGYQKGGEIDIMQVGNEGDPALKTLNGGLEEWELINGEEIKLDYRGEALAESPKDSVYWGVRWLYHKAQGITIDKKRYWRSWKDAVLGYGPGTEEYVDYIWMIYKEGIAVEENVRNILWIKKENGAIFLKLLFIIGFSLLIGGFGYYLGVRKYLGESTARKEVSAQEIYKMVDKIFLEDLEDYKKETMQYGDFFEDTLRKCRELGCIKQAVVYDKYKIIIENMRDNEHFLAAMGSLGAENNFFLRDIDNDGKNEIAFLMYDPLNRDNIILSAIDKNIDGNFELTEKNIKWGHSGSIEIFDLTGDLKPEIVSYISFGKGGECLFVYQYDYPEFKEIFTVREFLYPEYTFSDADNDQKMEIKVIGEGADRDIIEEVYEYDPNQNNFVLMSDESQGEGKYEDK